MGQKSKQTRESVGKSRQRNFLRQSAVCIKFHRACSAMCTGREVEREGEKHQCVVASHAPPTGHLAHNPGMCANWELNWGPFHSQASAQSTEPHQPGPGTVFFGGGGEIFNSKQRERERERGRESMHTVSY